MNANSANDTGLLVKKWEEAFNETGMQIARLDGFVTILDKITDDWPPLSNNDPMANGIITLIRAIKADLSRLEDLRSEEYKLQRQAGAA